MVGDGIGGQAMVLAETLRDRLPGLRVQLNCGGGKISNQLKRAFNIGATRALVLETAEDGQVQARLRHLHDDSAPQLLRCDEVADVLQGLISGA